MGASVTDRVVSAFRRKVDRVGAAVLTLLLLAGPVAAAERYALIITGAHGEASYEDQYARWRQTAVTAMLEKLAFGDANIVTLFEGGDAAHAATADEAGRLHVRSSGGQGSHLLRSMALANALALLPDGEGVAAGGAVKVMLLA